MARTISINEAESRLAEIIEEISASREAVVLTKDNGPAAVMMSVDAYESLIETMEILADPEMVAAIREAEEEMMARKFLTEEEFWREVDG
ncbi:MAG: type II toxin-antitoxin system Phd/YefM family antitoxin [Nitrospirae bacterium]|nr:type II toxin-antitoxin system Phd/YefM family antitoxin [Nitrospirota bacterium]